MHSKEILFQDYRQISVHLKCIICQEVFNNPVSLTCGHTYCKNCILGANPNAKLLIEKEPRKRQ